jgi:branched-chain amino acid transport system permease protein
MTTVSTDPLAGRRRLLNRPDGSFARAVIGVLLVAGALWAYFGTPYINLIGQSCAIFAVAAVGQSLLVGKAGQVAISGAAFMAIGSFSTGIMAMTSFDAFPIPVLVAAVVGLVVGFVAGLPGLRFRGLYLLLASLALQFIVQSITGRYQAERHPAGLEVPLLKIGSLDLSTGKNLFLALLVILGLVYALGWFIERTGVGLAWRALRESEEAAAISGIDVTRWKLWAFAISGSITAVAGSLYAYWIGRAESATYDILLSITLLTMLFIGGIASRLGAVLGAAVITTLPYLLQSHLPGLLSDAGISAGWYTNNQNQFHAGMFSLLFLLVVLFEPGGIEAILTRLERRVRRLVH